MQLAFNESATSKNIYKKKQRMLVLVGNSRLVDLL